MSGATNEWLTPPPIIAALGGWQSFDLDPATPDVMPWQTAQARYTARDDGLVQPWFGRVWLNPPYSHPLVARFLARMSAHGRGTAMIFVRSDGQYWHDHVLGAAHGLFFLLRKVRFYRPDGSVSKHGHFAPSVLCAYGANDLDVLAECTLDGTFVPLRLPRLIALCLMDAPWRDIVVEALRKHRGPVALADLYRVVANHPRTRRNPHWKAKVRQQLQRGAGRRVGPGQWEIAA
jgi:hypothetical protein